MPPQRIFFKFAPDSEYVPTPSVIDRIQDRAAEVDFTFELGEDIEPNYCVEGSNGTLDVAVAGNADLKNALIRIAIGGMEQVPAGFNIKTGQFEEGKFARPSLDTTMGPVIKDLLGGN